MRWSIAPTDEFVGVWILIAGPMPAVPIAIDPTGISTPPQSSIRLLSQIAARTCGKT